MPKLVQARPLVLKHITARPPLNPIKTDKARTDQQQRIPQQVPPT